MVQNSWKFVFPDFSDNSRMPWWIWLKCVLKWEKWISSKFFNFFLRFQRDIRQHYIIITYPKNIIWIHFKPYYSIFDSKTLHEIHISLMDFWLKIIKIWKIINLRTFWSKSSDLYKKTFFSTSKISTPWYIHEKSNIKTMLVRAEKRFRTTCGVY